MDVRDIWYRAAGALASVSVARDDSRRNREWATAEQRFLVVRHARNKPDFYDVLLTWLEEHFPALRARFELRLLTDRIDDYEPYIPHLPWLQDPVQAWSPTAYRQANQIAADCDSRSIPIINRVDRLTAAGKSSGAALMRAAGIRTADMARITVPAVFRETLYGLKPPLFVREDWRHCGPVFRADSEAEARRIPLGKFRRPVAVEYIDVRSSHDGLFRKYRYLAACEVGFPLSMHPGRAWFVKGSNTEFNDDLRDEEIEFLSRTDPNDAQFQAARRALGLDFVAFDYSYDRNGQLVVWEANPFPHLHFGSHHRSHRWPAVSRVMAAMAHLYAKRAGLKMENDLEQWLEWGIGAQAA